LRIGIVGDIMLGRRVESKESSNLISPDLLNLMRSCDIMCANLEGPITELATAESVASKPESIGILNTLSLVSIANNHITDYGIDGIQETIKHLSTNGIKYTGLSPEEYSPYTPLVIRSQESDVAFFGCVSEDLQNDPKSTYKISFLENRLLKESISAAKEEGISNIVVLAHCGIDYMGLPTKKIISLTEELIDAGANIVITNHPHVIGGYKYYKNGLIWFSLGDFIFDSDSSVRKKSVFLVMEMNEDRIEKLSFYPTVILDSLIVELAFRDTEKEIRNTVRKNSRFISKKTYSVLFPVEATRRLLFFQIGRIFEQYKRNGLKRTSRQLFRRVKYFPKYIRRIFRS